MAATFVIETVNTNTNIVDDRHVVDPVIFLMNVDMIGIVRARVAIVTMTSHHQLMEVEGENHNTEHMFLLHLHLPRCLCLPIPPLNPILNMQMIDTVLQLRVMAQYLLDLLEMRQHKTCGES